MNWTLPAIFRTGAVGAGRLLALGGGPAGVGITAGLLLGPPVLSKVWGWLDGSTTREELAKEMQRLAQVTQRNTERTLASRAYTDRRRAQDEIAQDEDLMAEMSMLDPRFPDPRVMSEQDFTTLGRAPIPSLSLSLTRAAKGGGGTDVMPPRSTPPSPSVGG